MVIAHTDCRMTKVIDDDIHSSIREQSGIDTRSLEFRTVSGQAAVLEADVQKIRSSPYLPADVAVVVGAVYDVSSGRVEIVVPADPVPGPSGVRER